mmetsp:Transcript_10403/g.22914  ORF Transcript_10403/g.22914 Transcript_10403/m.22914 type:complete len:128 (-) Transcript_10403:83-466(-)
MSLWRFGCCCSADDVKAGQSDATDPPVSRLHPPQDAGLATDSRKFTINLKKTEGTRLGVDVDLADGTSLMVDAINPGLVEDWNKNNPGLRVKPGDRIVAVNGVQGDAQAMAEACMGAKELHMAIQRP